jgi:hypothetical protein
MLFAHPSAADPARHNDDRLTERAAGRILVATGGMADA